MFLIVDKVNSNFLINASGRRTGTEVCVSFGELESLQTSVEMCDRTSRLLSSQIKPAQTRTTANVKAWFKVSEKLNFLYQDLSVDLRRLFT